jgi:hypothetical protein
MSTNFYIANPKKVTKYMGEGPLCIGHFCVNRFFSLYIYPELDLENFSDWVRVFSNGNVEITDDIGNMVSAEFLIPAIISPSRMRLRDGVIEEIIEADNQAAGVKAFELSPCGFIRRVIGEEGCVGRPGNSALRIDYVQTGNVA